MQFSVIIPTYNRLHILKKTLKALRHQTLGQLARDADSPQDFLYEVIVVDDGSSDGTLDEVQKIKEEYPVPLLCIHQKNRKQGSARNLGSDHARGTYLVFLGDDTVPSPSFLEEHRKVRSQASTEDHVVVIGYTPWPEEYHRTRFMEYVAEEGWQFGFSLIENPNNVPFNFFYTSNLSISSSFFKNSGGFDEDFSEYGWEDIELGLRLQHMGMRLVYHPEAIAHHHHRTTVRSFVGRQRNVGFSAWKFYVKHPDMTDFLNISSLPRYRIWDRIRMEILTWICSLTEKNHRLDFSSLYPDIMAYHYNQGLLRGQSNHQSKTGQ